jgi:hypothetical protein
MTTTCLSVDVLIYSSLIVFKAIIPMELPVPFGLTYAIIYCLCSHFQSLAVTKVLYEIYVLGTPSLLVLVKVCWISTTLEFF